MLLLHTEFMVSNEISFSESLGLEHEISVSSIHNLSRDPNLSSEVGSPPSPPISLTGASANGCQSNLLCVVSVHKKERTFIQIRKLLFPTFFSNFVKFRTAMFHQWSCHVIWASLGPTFMAAQQAGLKMDKNVNAPYLLFILE